MNRTYVFLGLALAAVAVATPGTIDSQGPPPLPAGTGVISVVPLTEGDELLLLESAGHLEIEGFQGLRAWSAMRLRGEVTELLDIAVVGQSVRRGTRVKIGDRWTPAARNSRGEFWFHYAAAVARP